MDNAKLWRAMNTAWDGLIKQFEPSTTRLNEVYSLDRRSWGLLLAVAAFEPEPTTIGHLLVRSPYTAVNSFQSRLEFLVEKGFLREIEIGSFLFTEAGRGACTDFITVARNAMESLNPFTPPEGEQIRELLGRLVASCLAAPPPPEPWSIRLSLKLIPQQPSIIPYIEQAFTCLAAYRDDAHLAAWSRASLSATAYEALTHFWRGEVRNLEELADHLEHRGHKILVYERALKELREHRYLNGTDVQPQITEEGRLFRNKVEAETDRLFFAPWSCLAEKEKKELGYLIKRLSVA